MRIKILSVLTAIMLSAVTLGTTVKASVKKDGSSVTPSTAITQPTGNTGSRQQLEILQSDYKLTPEQAMDRIKAEYLIENNGYNDDDEVVLIVGVDGDSLIEVYNYGGTGEDSVADYANSFSGVMQSQKIARTQKSVLNALKSKNLVDKVVYSYDTALNGFAIQTTYGNISAIEKTDGVKSVAISETYNRASVDTDVSKNEVEIDPDTGIYQPENMPVGKDGKPYSGRGTTVAILDSGFDMSHSVFNSPDFDKSNLVMTASTLTQTDESGKTLLSKLNAAKITKGLTASEVWYSDKIPFSYDYADKDADVFPYDSEHGTHVAGIIGGHDSVIKGIAPDAQLILMKVFPDLSTGGKTEDILLALEDAILLNVDAINMSLGSSCGFTREGDKDPDKENINAVYDRINESGISLITAASNSYSSSFGGEQGNTNFVTNPDSGTVGSPSTYKGALSVASISGTRSRYIVANMNGKKTSGQVFFYKESSSISAEENDFYQELVDSGALGIEKNLKDGDGKTVKGYSATLEYVTVSGTGKNINFKDLEDGGISIKGKIVLVRRGDNTFEEKARLAKRYGAVACIIYNNVEGDISMSMGKTAHFPTVSISKDDGEKLAKKRTGTMTINSTYLAGPFMSDFSSWGPTPSLELKPEITAHGGNIYSAVPGSYEEDGEKKYRYDHLSGTSMATPNLCGIVVLIRQYIKDTYPDKSAREVKNLVNQLMMSTADIALNEENNPYSPRKQGAGLANFTKTVNTKAYITVDGSDRTKLELGDDPTRKGVYTMKFNVENLSDEALTYDCSLIGMTETVSSSDDKHVAETPYILSNNIKVTVNGKAVGNKKVSVPASGKAVVEVTYTLNTTDKKYLNEHFENGMYVEGFVKLTSSKNDVVNLNVPFLAFYGDWTEAPMFDKTYYEVESTKYDASVVDDDKIKADYYATTPYGSYYYNYMIPLGTYLYSDANIPATEEHISISDSLGTIDGINTVAAGLLRGAKKMTFTITDKVTGEVVWTRIDYNANKAFSNGGSPVPYYEELKVKPSEIGLVNNRQYNFTMSGELDYGDGGVSSNKRNSYSFDFYLDNEAPVLRNAEYEKEYDDDLKKWRYYMTLTIYDNHYAMSVTPIIFNSSSSYTVLSEDPIPVQGGRGTDTQVNFEITDYLDAIYNDALIPNALCFAIDDYALNTNLYVCQLPGTKGEFKFTDNGEAAGEDLIIFNAYENELVDLKPYLYTADKTVGDNREQEEYLAHLQWISSNENVFEVKGGVIKTKKAGRATITVRERMDGKQAVMIIDVKKGPRPTTDTTSGAVSASLQASIEKPASGGLESLTFSRFKTIYAYARGAQTSEIGTTGSTNYLVNKRKVSMYPGEKIQLFYDLKPWYVDDNYELTYTSSNESAVTVDKNGIVVAVSNGSGTSTDSAVITLEARDKVTGSISYISATLTIEVLSPFVIENRMLVAYKGMGDKDGNVIIPDDEGILYIGAYSFPLYTTDNTIEVDEDDYDKNKFPGGNSEIKRVVIPEGVLEIQKYAFYNCTTLKEVVLPETLQYIREYAFSGATKLETIKTRVKDAGGDGYEVLSEDGELGKDTIVIGAYAFNGCRKLKKINLSRINAIGIRAFQGCYSLTEVNVSTLRNSGREIFKDCTSLNKVTMNEHTKLSYAMFVNTGFTEIEVYGKVSIPEYCFANCHNLTKVTFKNSLEKIDTGAFSGCENLTEIVCGNGVTINEIGQQVFYNDSSLESVTLPNGNVALGAYAFYKCSSLKKVVFQPKTKITSMGGSVFADTKFTVYDADNKAAFVVDGNENYKVDAANPSWLLSKNGDEIIIGIVADGDGDIVIDTDKISKIGSGAFTGQPVTSVTFTGGGNIEIDDYAFMGCYYLTKVILPATDGQAVIGDYAFAQVGRKIVNNTITYNENGFTVENLDKVNVIGDYAFSNSNLSEAVLGDGLVAGEGAFYSSQVGKVTLGKASSYGLGAFQACKKLETVKLPDGSKMSDDEKITLGQAMFANCDKLGGLVDLSGVTDEIPVQAFYNSKLTAVRLGGVRVIGNGAFAECAALGSVKFLSVVNGAEVESSAALEVIGDYAFGKLTLNGSAPSFGEITLPATLKYIGTGAFMYNTSLESVELPDGVTFKKGLTSDGDEATKMHFDGEYVFFNCSNLTTVVLPDSVDYIGDYMFAQCESIENVTHKAKVIGNYAFTQPQTTQNARSLKTFDFTTVEKIGEAAFANNELLTEVINAPNLKEIGDYAFKDVRISGIDAPKLERIGDYAFNCVYYGRGENLKSVTIPSTIKYIGVAAFTGQKNLETFNYKEAGGAVVTTKQINDYASIENGALYVKMPSGYAALNSVPANWKVNGKVQTTLEVRNDVYRIEFYAANANKNLTRIILPETLKLIGNYAFYGCTGLVPRSESDMGGLVEFRSYSAPALENSYNANSKLSETAAGYGMVHPYYDLFRLELCYYNFVDLAGSNLPIRMTYPNTVSGTTEGYDSLIYKAYFGNLASRNEEYLAMDKNMSDFIDYAKKLIELKSKGEFTLANESEISAAVAAYNAINLADAERFYGKNFTEEEWAEYCSVTLEAKEAIRKIKIESASDALKALDKDIMALPDKFSVDILDKLIDISARINDGSIVRPTDRILLNFDKYDKLIEEYGEYLKNANAEFDEIEKTVFSERKDFSAAAQAILGSAGMILAAAAVKRKFF